MNERLHVLGKTETSIAEACVEELAANARVEAHGMGDFLDVGADFFAEIGDDVGVTDFQRKKRIRSVLDELGAVDGGDEEFGFVARGAGAVVHWAAEALFENGAVDFAEFRGGGGILDADDDAVRMEKGKNSGGFPEKRRSGSDA